MKKQVTIIYDTFTGPLLCETITVEGRRLNEIYYKTLLYIRDSNRVYQKGHFAVNNIVKQIPSKMTSFTHSSLQDYITRYEQSI